jgi:Ca2+-binding EF-hand superfamily protein
VKVEEIA